MTTPADPGLPRPANPDLVSRAVLTRALVALLASLLPAWGLDANLSGPLAEVLVVAVPVAFTLAGAAWGSRDARNKVTPTTKYGTPRDFDGAALQRAAHDPPAGYPPRVDRRGVDRDPGDRY